MYIFCRRSHSSTKRDILADQKVRKQIIMNDKRCFACLRLRNSAKTCQKNFKCFKCNGRHSYSICTFVPKVSFYRRGQEHFPEESNALNQQQRNSKINFSGDNSSTNNLAFLSQNSILL